jgi:hypothetical protein
MRRQGGLRDGLHRAMIKYFSLQSQEAHPQTNPSRTCNALPLNRAERARVAISEGVVQPSDLSVSGANFRENL